MYEQYAILYYNTGPTCRDPAAMNTPPLRYKREALAVHRDIQTDSSSYNLLTLVGRQYNTQWT